MDYTTLDEITETIIQLIIEATGTSNTFVVPRLLTKDEVGISFYLYHVQENSHYKNYPSPGSDPLPVTKTPMGLNLFYQLTCNIKKDGEENVYEEQQLMSTAMKVLHDNPVIKKTRKNDPGYPVVKDIDIKVTMQNLTPSESVQYWAASESAVRLSAYYEVSVVFLLPEPVRSISGRVLTYGNFIFTERAPRITSSESTLEFFVPPDLIPHQVTIQPAQAKIADAGPVVVSNIIRFNGSGFTGNDLQIRIVSPLWNKPALAGTVWNVTRLSESAIEMTLRPTAVLIKSAISKDMIPGLYSAQICKTDQRTLPNGTVKTFEHLSNLFPFSVIPVVDTFLPGLIAGTFEITGYLFYHSEMTAEDVQVYLGGDKYMLNPSGTPGYGEFSIIAPVFPNPEKIVIKPPSTLDGTLTLRIMVRGVESEPKWVNIP